ncbi:N-acetylglucosamine kinase [Microbacterium alcoholitolerans]|uniref:N-acetylglucosamine kinase n=1 Tax=unclassified Microbacterium TaxID=2609290 RepID=UPI003D17EC92
MTRVLGIDVGGSGSRVAIRLTGAEAGDEFAADGIGVTTGGSTAPARVLALLRCAAQQWPDEIREVAAIGVGTTGMGTLVPQPGELAEELTNELRRLTGRLDVGAAVAIDAVTAHLGALGGRPGAVIALGTGAIAIGGDGRERWHRVDGWGHLLGDRGAGAWIGIRGLEAAMRAYDQVDDSGTALLETAKRRFGEPLTWPSQFYTRHDRAGVLAGFAADVAQLAAAGDPSADAIMALAGQVAARSVVAALQLSPEPVIAATGGIFRAGGTLEAQFLSTVAMLRPDAKVRAPAGNPLDGALLLAHRVAAGEKQTHVPFVWVNR